MLVAFPTWRLGLWQNIVAADKSRLFHWNIAKSSVKTSLSYCEILTKEPLDAAFQGKKITDRRRHRTWNARGMIVKGAGIGSSGRSDQKPRLPSNSFHKSDHPVLTLRRHRKLSLIVRSIRPSAWESLRRINPIEVSHPSRWSPFSKGLWSGE